MHAGRGTFYNIYSSSSPPALSEVHLLTPPLQCRKPTLATLQNATEDAECPVGMYFRPTDKVWPVFIFGAAALNGVLALYQLYPRGASRPLLQYIRPLLTFTFISQIISAGNIAFGSGSIAGEGSGYKGFFFASAAATLFSVLATGFILVALYQQRRARMGRTIRNDRSLSQIAYFAGLELPTLVLNTLWGYEVVLFFGHGLLSVLSGAASDQVGSIASTVALIIIATLGAAVMFVMETYGVPGESSL